MGNFDRGGNNRFSGPRGGSKFGGGRDSGSSGGFAKKSWGPQSGGNRDAMMHKAVCSNCGRDCEVPFRPVNGKPVYCKDCFGDKGSSDRGERFPRKENNDRAPRRDDFEPRKGGDELDREIKALHIKIDRLMTAVEALSRPKPVLEKEVETKEEEEAAEAKVLKRQAGIKEAVKKATKKPAAKKKK